MIFPQSEALRLLDRIADLILPCPPAEAVEHLYPWDAEILFPSAGTQITLVGYGSLMNRKSALRTFSTETVRDARPAVVLGARRIYEYVMSPQGRRVYGPSKCQYSFGVLNARPSEHIEDWFNGMAFSLRMEDMQKLVSREYAYDLVPAWSIPWDELDAAPRLTYFLSCRQASFDGRKTIDPEMLPHPTYHALCEEGCREISPGFLEAFRSSTWVRNARYSESRELMESNGQARN
ncbi:hypothetical protein AB1L30_12555 [Bremerella sp. JC817]|uniref:hypothetical protein n=1 Tax=Bremerella sp. JC817 TaxID=3231756 RepID=UPI0034579318